MPPVKSMDKISATWARRAEAAGPEYRDGIENPRKDWATETKNAEASYKAAVVAAAGAGRFGRGVAKAGTDKWKRNTIAKGLTRWPEGISLAKSAYEEGFGPYREVIVRTTLPPRGPRGAPGNIARVAALAKALHDEKMKRVGA